MSFVDWKYEVPSLRFNVVEGKKNVRSRGNWYLLASTIILIGRRKSIWRLSEEESELRMVRKKKAFTLHKSYVDYVMEYRLYFLRSFLVLQTAYRTYDVYNFYRSISRIPQAGMQKRHSTWACNRRLIKSTWPVDKDVFRGVSRL